jgi:hypothetical protein
MVNDKTLPHMKRGRGNRCWGQPLPPLRGRATEFEMQIKRMGLSKPEYVASSGLREWCERNRNRVYVPEWLLEAWGLTVDSVA